MTENKNTIENMTQAEKNENKNKQGSHMALGMSLGMMIGFTWGMYNDNAVWGMSLGTLIGMMIGSLFECKGVEKKEEKDKEE